MTNNSIPCVSRGCEFTAGSLFLLAYGSAKSQEILKNLNKAIKKNLKRDSLLEKTEVFQSIFVNILEDWYSPGVKTVHLLRHSLR